jgi:hypothetical protein
MSTVSRVQAEVLEMAIELIRLDNQLHQLAHSLPVPPDLSDMNNDWVPHDEGAHLHGVIQCVRSDLLQDAIATLRAAAHKKDSELRKDFKRLLAKAAEKR